MQFILSALFFFFSLFSIVFSAPVQLEQRDVFVPPVLLPNVHSVWKIGSKQTVSWDVTHPPKQITNNKAMIVLAKNSYLDIEHPLATNIDVMAGKVQITVPNVTPGKDYQIVVFGDSGNAGAFFSITH
ncbi:hypothetical protein CVT24_003496 [Panaeolus cyanescens]|uniref:Yeast cell wall synthesis Kre9/Knh1-like N-terminal domain-containing protein n=1 Tax=Panaeolus cyanescens TaxID=181874 RepID=A0A409WMY0_9AGAR|nr:hypothetical protein CVT24_003496 [Panaeolus cyanescens]